MCSTNYSEEELDMYKCEYFKIHELVPQHVYEDRGDKAWALLDDRLLEAIDILREHLGSCTINDWWWGGSYTQSGFRTDSEVGARFSQHRFGRGADLKFKDHSADYVRQWIRSNWSTVAPNLNITLELGVSWVHLDVRNTNKLISEFNP